MTLFKTIIYTSVVSIYATTIPSRPGNCFKAKSLNNEKLLKVNGNCDANDPLQQWTTSINDWGDNTIRLANSNLCWHVINNRVYTKTCDPAAQAQRFVETANSNLNLGGESNPIACVYARGQGQTNKAQYGPCPTTNFGNLFANPSCSLPTCENCENTEFKYNNDMTDVEKSICYTNGFTFPGDTDRQCARFQCLDGYYPNSMGFIRNDQMDSIIFNCDNSNNQWTFMQDERFENALTMNAVCRQDLLCDQLVQSQTFNPVVEFDGPIGIKASSAGIMATVADGQYSVAVDYYSFATYTMNSNGHIQFIKYHGDATFQVTNGAIDNNSVHVVATMKDISNELWLSGIPEDGMINILPSYHFYVRNGVVDRDCFLNVSGCQMVEYEGIEHVFDTSNVNGYVQLVC